MLNPAIALSDGDKRVARTQSKARLIERADIIVGIDKGTAPVVA